MPKDRVPCWGSEPYPTSDADDSESSSTAESMDSTLILTFISSRWATRVGNGHERVDVREPVVVFAVEVALVHHDVVQTPLLQLLTPDVLLDSVLADQTVDVDFPRLADTVAPVHSLPIHRRVPVGVVEDDRVGTRQRKTHTTSAGGGDEQEYLLVLVESGDDTLPHVHLGGPVESDVREPHEVDPVL
ncbi:oligomycin resistance ATP-dependent permease, putative [Babesia ovata]|uniref:Oligomycin resistance ATP-dependent permease, putative n=1 Tax=Babesia ovata TaxID=189622 RepID=A0A2H6KAW9_9APIC|nr:oligomycin resistance ATP-dependent permease, putative [Babesia ovata]GBE60142.1 oligomycin resistance ATP-dependent permease, putative [Babesia ovata]